MKGLLLILACLVFFFSYGFSAPENYPRPWENAGWVAQNEHIADLGFTQIWFVLQPTMNVSQMDALGLMLPFQESLEESQVDAIFSECTRKDCAAAEPLGAAVRDKQFADEAVRYTQINQLMPFGPMDTAVESIHAWNIYNYAQNWKSAMGNTLYAAEITGAELNGKRATATQYLGAISKSGICDRDYAGPSTGICTGAIDDVACNSTGLWDSIPDMEWYPACMRNEWAASAKLDGRYANMTSGYENALEQLEILRVGAEEKRAEADGESRLLSLHELNRIIIGAQSTDVTGVSSIRNEYSRANIQYAEANSLMANAERTASYRGYGWYKTQYSLLLGAAEKYDDFIASADSLIEGAQTVVGQQKLLAEEDLNSAERNSGILTQNGQLHLQLARDACAFAGAETALGIKFEKYGECRMHARIASMNLETENTTGLDVAVAEADALIKKAETDGVDTSTEKALLRIVKERKPASSLSLLSRIRDGVYEKAALKYAGLPSERARLMAIVNGGGSQLAFLKTWFEGEECYAGDALDYTCALGRLSSMEESYAKIDEEVLLRAGEVIGNALMIDYYETGTAASLHGESGYGLVVQVKNVLGIGADNVMFDVPAGAELRRIDLVDGKERVRTVAYENGVATIQLYNISAGEAVVLRFSRNYTPCTTSDYGVNAVGEADGDAEVVEHMKLDCSNGVDALYVGDEAEQARLDGETTSVSNGIARTWISVGEHELELMRKVSDAYSISKGQETANTIGMKTSVEYMLDIIPDMDLDYVPIIIDESAKKPTKLEVLAYTGERITNQKNLGSGVTYLELNGLEEGQTAKLRVRYEFSDAKEYVEREISLLSNMSLGGTARSYLNNASALYAAGEYDEALSALEMARAQMEKDAKERLKLVEKDQELRDEIGRKLSELRAAIDAAEAQGVDESYVDEMRARAEYLQDMLSRNLTGASTASPLEDVDLGWEGRELTKIQKYIKDSEAKIKKEWMALGIDDLNMSSAVMKLEEKNAFFSGTMMFDDAIGALSAVQTAQAALEGVKARYNSESANEKTVLQAAVSDAIEMLGRYEDERNSVPRGHAMASIFTRSPSWIREKLGSLNKSDDVDAAISEAASLEGEMEGVIKVLKGESERIGKSVDDLYKEEKGSMSDVGKTAVEKAVESAESYYNQKHYVKAMLTYESALAAMENGGGDNLDMLILAVTALLIIGIVAVLLLRGGKNPFPAQGKKEMAKKLKRAPDEEDLE